MEVADSSKSKVEENRRECETVFEDMVLKRVRQLKSQAQVANASASYRLSSGAASNGDADDRSSSRQDDDGGYSADLDLQRSNSGAADRRYLDRDAANGEEGLHNSGRGQAADQESSPASSSARANAVELLNMPMRSKARDERTRRRLLKASPPSPKTTEEESDPPSLPPGSPTTVLGFTNLGNTCYFNASIQALLTATHFFPEHTYIKDTLEMADVPVLNTFT